MSSLSLTLLYLLAAVLGVVACRSMKLPPMLGYLAAGVLIGPHALALAQDSAGVRHLGEFGVVFLMFAIGLEFSLPKLRAMRRHVFGLGMLQVLLTMAASIGGSLLLARLFPAYWNMGWQTAEALLCGGFGLPLLRRRSAFLCAPPMTLCVVGLTVSCGGSLVATKAG